MSDIFREVDEDVRRDRMIALAKRYGPYVLGLLIAVIAVVAVWQIRETRHESALRAASEQYEALTAQLAETGSLPDAADVAALPEGHRTLLTLHRAAERVDAGETMAAVALYDELAQGGTGDPVIQDYAALQAARLMMGRAPADEVIVRLEPLSGGDGTVAAAALEMLAAQHIALNEWASAKAYLEEVTALQTSGFPAQTRAQEMLDLVEAELARTGGQPDQPAVEAPAPDESDAAPGAPDGPADDAATPDGEDRSE